MAKVLDKIFRLDTTGLRTTDAIIAGRNFEGKNRHIHGRNFPMRPFHEGPREIVYLEFDQPVTSNEVFAEAVLQRLNRPVYEDALLFGEQHPKEQEVDPVVFLHEPWRRWRFGRRLVMVLSTHACGRRALLLIYFADKKWQSNCRFAFMRRL